MLQAIVDFFKNLFSGFSGGKKETTPTPSTSKIPEITPEEMEELPEIIDVEDPQDGADVEESNDEVVEVDAKVDTTPIPKEDTAPIDTSIPTHTPKFLWILDNGHGKKTKGKRSPKWDDGKQLLEYEFNRAIVKKIIDQLKEKGVRYHNLVPEVEVGNILKERVARANKLNQTADLPAVYVSVHSNAGQENLPGNWTSAKGIETWYYRTSLNGRKIAKIFQKHLIDKTGWTNRNVRTGMSFYVLKHTAMPAVLTENGFFNNKKEGRKLLSEETRQLIADAHVEAILEIEKFGFDGFQG